MGKEVRRVSVGQTKSSLKNPSTKKSSSEAGDQLDYQETNNVLRRSQHTDAALNMLEPQLQQHKALLLYQQ